MLTSTVEVNTLDQIKDAFEKIEQISEISIIKINHYNWDQMKSIKFTCIILDNIIGQIEIRVKG